MKAKLCILFSIFILSSPAFSHSGKTDSNGGHNCSEKSKQKGLCSGYHYHRSSVAHAKTEATKYQDSKADAKVQQPASAPVTAT